MVSFVLSRGPDVESAKPEQDQSKLDGWNLKDSLLWIFVGMKSEFKRSCYLCQFCSCASKLSTGSRAAYQLAGMQKPPAKCS